MEQRHYDQDLTDFKNMLLAMGGEAETIVRQAMRSLAERDDERARQVEKDDKILDNYEVEVDELAIVLLARAPLAGDLRLITVGMKISQDLERVGDEATTIARQTLVLNAEPTLRLRVDPRVMASTALEMLKDALDAFVHLDSEKARHLIPRDKEVDQLYKDLRSEASGLMKASPDNVERALCFLTIARSLERIGDHASNIAEEVVYLCEARDIRHKKEAVQPQTNSE